MYVSMRKFVGMRLGISATNVLLGISHEKTHERDQSIRSMIMFKERHSAPSPQRVPTTFRSRRDD